MKFTPRWMLGLIALAAMAACATETHRAVEATKPVSAGTQYNGPKSSLIVAKFNNRSTYLQGMFSDGVDRLGGQAKTLLIGHLQSSGRFDVLDRDNLPDLARESQTAYSKVTINVVDVRTSRVVHSVQGAGEYALSNREVVGFGGTASYDSTLNGKVLDLAIREAVDRLAESIDKGQWKPGN
jgi:curli biogenesis system outer membrane secretion channel CsgG